MSPLPFGTRQLHPRSTSGRHPRRPTAGLRQRLGRRFLAHRSTVRTALFASLLSIVAVAATAGVAAAPAAASSNNWAPVHAGDFPDPSILHYGGVYYGFATQNFAAMGHIINIQVSVSVNGTTWIPTSLDALPALPGWAQEGNTWAPSVAYSSQANEFVMYYTATDADSGDQCIGVATAPVADPAGPYTDQSSGPVECQTGAGGSIDPDIFTDDNGNSWLLWKNDGNHLVPPQTTSIWSVPLNSNLLTPTAATPTQILSDDEPWQNGIVEGPNMMETPAHAYYLFYAGSDEGASTYGIGWASCPSGPAAPCTDESTAAPLLSTSPGMSGPGGPNVYSLPSGQTVMAFAAWQGSTIGYLACGIRPMYLADLTFSTGGSPPVPSLSPDPAGGSSAAASPTCPSTPLPPPGYWQVAADGGVFTFGGANFYGSTGSLKLNRPVVGMAPTPDRGGYWLVASDGGVFAFGDAGFYGSTGSMTLNRPIIGMIPTLDGRGYWLIASDGGVFAFGDASFYGSAGGENLTYPVTAAAPSFLDGGYWLVDSDGQVYSYGDAQWEGQPAFAPGGYRITGLVGTHSSSGYWMASANGNVANFGDAAPYGSMIGTNLNAPIVGIAATRDGAGYWLQGADGGIFTFGDAPFYGSMGGHPLNAPMVGIAAS